MVQRTVKRVVVLFDLSTEPPDDHDYSEYLKEEAFLSERKVFKTLQSLGYETFLAGVHSDLFRLTRELRRLQPDLIFNMTEAFEGKRDLSPQLAGVFELLRIPYTGTQSLGLGLAQDKNLAKKILAHHRIRVPRWVASHRRRPLKTLKRFEFPAFVKPSREEASEGISRDSLVETEKDCLDRVKFLHEKFESDVIIEEFITGRELYTSVLGNKRLQIFPTRELMFREFPDDMPKFATYKAKWDEDYRKRWGIRNEFARGLSELQLKQINAICKRSFQALHLSGFARFDLRLNSREEVVVIEANPNPSLSPDDDFALSAEKFGLSFEQMIEKIIDLAIP